MSEPISIEALRTRAYEAIAVKGPGSIGLSRQAGQHMLALVEAVEADHELRQAREDLAKWETTKFSDLPIAAELFALDREDPGYYDEMARITTAFWNPLRERVERAEERCDETLARFTDWPPDQKDTPSAAGRKTRR